MARPIHQDYIVRQRFSNALPPPPGAPKLLDIPTGGLRQYCIPSYASRMARNQPINIEADADLGMPINLVGMPGVFDGDESSIQAPLKAPPVHPNDRNLLRPLKSLGQPKKDTGISFLRRTQYTAEDRGRHGESSRHAVALKRKKLDNSREDPTNILRSTIKGFDIANPEDMYKGPDSANNIRGATATAAETEAWNHPKHAAKPHLRVLDSYPILPDLDAITDERGFMIAKFNGNPTDITENYDERMETALLHALEPPLEVLAEMQAKLAAHQADPAKNPAPGPPHVNYELFLPTDETSAQNIKKLFDVDNPRNTDEALYTYASEGTSNDSFRYNHIRVYETGLQSDHTTFPYQEVALALHDVDDNPRLQKAAYYYPILSKQQLKPRRTVDMAQMGVARRAHDDADKLDVVQLTVRELDEDEIEKRSAFRDEVDVRDGS